MFRTLRVAAAVALLASCVAEDGTRTVITAASDQAAEPLPDLNDAVELERALVSFAECVEKSFPIVMRFRAEQFNGLSTEVVPQREEDGDRVDRVVADCNGQLDLERRTSVYQSEHPLGPEDQRALVDDFISCAGQISAQISGLLSEANLDSPDSVMGFLSELVPGNAGLDGDDLIAVSECQSEMTGPERVFSDGHAWFIP
jgi:hypothetical protein